MSPRSSTVLLVLVALSGAAHAAAPAAAASAPPLSTYDGTWAVSLTCEEFKPANLPPAQAYTVEFTGTIKAGALEAQHGKPGSNDYLKFVGKITPGGKVQIQSTGAAGNTYTLRGRFDNAKGVANRMELRPCRATFTKR